MGRGFKKFGVRVLLWSTKGFVYLRNILNHGVGSSFIRLFQKTGRGFLYGILFVVSPVYGWYRRGRRGLKRILENTTSSKWLGPFSHRYLLHGLTIIITVVTILANLTTPLAGAEEFGSGRLVLDIIGVDEGFELIGLPTLPENFDFAVSPLESSGSESPPRTYLSYTGEAVFQPYLPITETSVAPRTKIEEYTIEEGDTLAGIAVKFQLRLQTLLQSNNLNSRSIINPGKKLTILPVDGLVHKIKKNETIGSIAKKYRVKDGSILTFNRITDPTSIQIGQELIIPGGKMPRVVARAPAPIYTNIPARAPVDSGAKLLWPTVDHRINQYFTWRHNGLDINGRMRVPIYAAEGGVVIESRWAGAYGRMVLIKHDNGMVTRYAHNMQNLVKVGERVTRGQTIALIGSTGRSTGPHVHFEVIIGGKRVNPLTYTR